MLGCYSTLEKLLKLKENGDAAMGGSQDIELQQGGLASTYRDYAKSLYALPTTKGLRNEVVLVSTRNENITVNSFSFRVCFNARLVFWGDIESRVALESYGGSCHSLSE